jgi:Uma2 family endonuclease
MRANCPRKADFGYHRAMATQTLVTAEQFDKLPLEEGEQYELLDGELLEMPSANLTHNAILTILGGSLVNYLRPQSLGMCVVETEFAVGPSRRLKPDAAVLLAEKWAAADRLRIPVQVIPDLVFEIVSPSESAYNLERKVAAYLDAGTTEAIVIYPDPPHAYVHTTSNIRKVAGTETLTSAVLPGWSLPLAELFAGL